MREQCGHDRARCKAARKALEQRSLANEGVQTPVAIIEAPFSDNMPAWRCSAGYRSRLQNGARDETPPRKFVRLRRGTSDWYPPISAR